MSGLPIQGQSNVVAEVTGAAATDSIQRGIHAALAFDHLTAGHVVVAGESDDGARTGAKVRRQLEIGQDYRARVALDSLVFDEGFPGAAVSSNQWQTTLTTMTVGVANGVLSLNSGNSVALNAVARVQSYSVVPLYGTVPAYVEFDMAYMASALQTFTTVDMGVGYAATTAAPTIGAYFQFVGSTVQAVLNYNGTEIATALAGDPILPNIFYHYTIEWTDSEVVFWVDDVVAASIPRPPGNPGTTAIRALPVLIRQYNTGTVASAVQVRVGSVNATNGDVPNGATLPQRAALLGRAGIAGQPGGTMGSTANYANNAAPAAATLSNTAAGYTTLGGRFLFTTLAGAETDFALFAFLVPAGSATALGQSLMIHSIRIDAVNIGAAVATTATILEWGIGVGATAVSLATAKGAATRAVRRLSLGVMGLIVGAGIGTSPEAIKVDFLAPLIVEPGTYVHVILKLPIGTATASQQIRGSVIINANFI